MVYLVIKAVGSERTVVYASQDRAKAIKWAAAARDNYVSEYYIKEMRLH